MNQNQICICHFPGCEEKVFTGVFCTPHLKELKNGYEQWLKESGNAWVIDMSRGKNAAMKKEKCCA